MAILSEYLNSNNSVIDLLKYADPDHTRTVDVPRQAGLDRVVVSLRIISIDWNLFEEAQQSTAGKVLVYAHDCRNKERILQICKEEPKNHWYSSFRVQIGSSTFSVRKCNLPNSGDIALLNAVISPIPGHEVLGNIHNLTAGMEQERILSLMDSLQTIGIYVDRTHALIREAEININLVITGANKNFSDALEILRPYRLCLPPRFQHSDYWDDGEELLYLTKLHNIQKKEPVSNTVRISQPRKTSFNATSKYIDIKVYDKRYETIVKSKGAVDYMTSLTRIEFLVKSRNEILCYFVRKENLFELTQEDVTNAFQLLFRTFIKEPLRTYYSHMNDVLEDYFEKIDITQYAWRKNLVLNLSNMLKESDSYFILPFSELLRYVGYIPASSVRTNKARIARSLYEEIRAGGSFSIRVTESNPYEELIDWLSNVPVDGEEQNLIYVLSSDE